MNIARKLCLLAAAVVAGGVFAPCAQAQYGGGGYGWGGGWPYNFQSGIYGRTNAYSLPYFSLHPPVYYSHVVPRPYGFSPFAAPPGMIPAEMQVMPASEVIENPHYKPGETKPEDAKPEEEKTGSKKSIGRTTSLRREIMNPHYQPREARVAARLENE